MRNKSLLEKQLENKAKTSYEIFLLWNEKVDKGKWVRLEGVLSVIRNQPSAKELLKLLEEFNPHFDIPSGYAIPVVVFKQMEDLEKKWWEIRGKIEAFLNQKSPEAKELEKLRDNALEWVKENLLKKDYEEIDRRFDGDEGLKQEVDEVAYNMCNAIQVFMNREVLPKFEAFLHKISRMAKNQTNIGSVTLTGAKCSP